MIIIFICTWSRGEKNFTHQSISGWITSSHSRSSDLVTNFFTHINDEVFYTYVYVLYYLYKNFLVLLCLHCSHINKCISFKVSTFVHDLKLLLSIGSCYCWWNWFRKGFTDTPNILIIRIQKTWKLAIFCKYYGTWFVILNKTKTKIIFQKMISS